ncbi:MAG TPA: DUF481 domain-containing protein [Opitutus sp.]|nr:DUF481 domain-containing protein [Opitutus sp.]
MKLFSAPGVECGVTSGIFRARRGELQRIAVLALLGLSLAARPCAAAPEAVLAPAKPAATAGKGGRAAKSPAADKKDLDELVYSDGDRVGGHFVRQDGDTIIFKSERFGLLHVPAKDAQLTLAKPTPAAKAAVAAAKPEGEKTEIWQWPFSPIAMAKALGEFFGSWHGKFAVSTGVMHDTAEHDSVSAQAHLQRKWKSDEVELNGSYDFATANNVTSTDMMRANGSWRHDLPCDFFGTYRPTLEWNRNYYRDDAHTIPADYLLLQQEVGAGVNVIKKDQAKLRTGLSENIFSVWVTPEPVRSQETRTVESAFVEAELKLPWRISVSDRGTFYYSIVHDTEGWENHFQIDKKLTETLTMGVQHEVRTNNPGINVSDYRRLKFLFGFDF